MKSRLSRLLELLPVWAAAATLLLTAGTYGWFHRMGTPLLGIDAYWLVGMVRVEWLAVHSFPFIMIIALQRPGLPQWEGVRCLAFGLFLSMYLAGAHAVAGWSGVFLFFSLTASTYLGFLVNLEERIHKLPELGLRWVCNFGLLAFLSVWFRLPSNADDWSIENGSLSVGGLYFLCLACLELSGLYRDPSLLNAGRRISERFAQLGEALPRPPEIQSKHSPLYWAVMPILGSAVMNFAPLFLAGYLAGAGARLIDALFEWPLSAHIQRWWFPAIMTLVLLPMRGYQFRSLLKIRSRAVVAILIALYLLVAILRYHRDATYHFAYSLLPEDAYEGFLLLEIPLLVSLVPAMWLVLAFPKDVSHGTRASASGS